MTQTFELAAFTAHEGHEQDLLAERTVVIAALRRSFPGLMSAWLTRRDDSSWLDVILWRTREDAEYSAAHVREVPEAVAWFKHLDEFRTRTNRTPAPFRRLLWAVTPRIPGGNSPRS